MTWAQLAAGAAVAAVAVALTDAWRTVRPGVWFGWSELTVTSTGLRNEPPPDVRASLVRLVRVVLDPLRWKLGVPVIVTSGYRSPAVNAAVGGSSTSDHMAGRAVDVRVEGLSSRELARKVLSSGVPFDQLIWYDASRHVHIGYRHGKNRRVVLRQPAIGPAVSAAP